MAFRLPIKLNMLLLNTHLLSLIYVLQVLIKSFHYKRLSLVLDVKNALKLNLSMKLVLTETSKSDNSKNQLGNSTNNKQPLVVLQTKQLQRHIALEVVKRVQLLPLNLALLVLLKLLMGLGLRMEQVEALTPLNMHNLLGVATVTYCNKWQTLVTQTLRLPSFT